jgi:hypothetical protein
MHAARRSRLKTLRTATSLWLSIKQITLHLNWTTSKPLSRTSIGSRWPLIVLLYRLRDNFDQDVLGYLAGFEQAALHDNASVARTTTPGTKANSAAGADELLASMKLNRASFGNITLGGDNSIPVAPRLPGATSLSSTRCRR